MWDHAFFQDSFFPIIEKKPSEQKPYRCKINYNVMKKASFLRPDARPEILDRTKYYLRGQVDLLVKLAWII